MKKIALAFYISDKYGSDYKVGNEYIKTAWEIGFDTIITSDIKYNSTKNEIEKKFPGVDVIVLPSIIKTQKNLYKYNDFLPQSLWHLHAMRYIKHHIKYVNVIWVTPSSAQPWFPIAGYFNIAEKIIWGPSGGGDYPPFNVVRRYGLIPTIREFLRKFINETSVKLKLKYLESEKIKVLARTNSVAADLRNNIKTKNIDVFPEFLEVLKTKILKRNPSISPKFIWAGQDIPRKDVLLAFRIFKNLKNYFPNSTLDIFGVENRYSGMSDVNFHGWVNKVPWVEFQNDGVFILSSFREGISTVLVEALENGLCCIANPVGAIPEFENENIILLPKDIYYDDCRKFYDELAQFIINHLKRTEVEIKRVNFADRIKSTIHEFLIEK